MISDGIEIKLFFLIPFVVFFVLFYFAIDDLVKRINNKRVEKNKKSISIISIKILLSSLFFVLLFLLAFVVHFNINDFLVVLPYITIIIFFYCMYKVFNSKNNSNNFDNFKNNKLIRVPFLIGLLLSILIVLALYFIASFNIF